MLFFLSGLVTELDLLLKTLSTLFLLKSCCFDFSTTHLQLQPQEVAGAPHTQKNTDEMHAS